MRRYAFGAAAFGLCACTLLTDLDGLEAASVPRADDGGAESAADAGPDALADARADAAAEGGCKGDKGPTPVRVGTYCVDSTEVKGRDYQEFLAATAGDAGGQPPECAWNTSYAPSIAADGNRPVFGADWCDARAYCAWAGKRLCGKIGGGALAPSVVNNSFSSEWYRACSKDGTQGFPYGKTHDPNACKGPDYDGGGGPVDVGTLATCEGGYPGLFDMAGNLREWEDSCEGDGGAATKCIAHGGSFASADGTGCGSIQTSPRDRAGQNDLTIRCCSDLD